MEVDDPAKLPRGADYHTIVGLAFRKQSPVSEATARRLRTCHAFRALTPGSERQAADRCDGLGQRLRVGQLPWAWPIPWGERLGWTGRVVGGLAPVDRDFFLNAAI